MSSPPAGADAPSRELSPADHWDRIEAHLEAVAEDLRAIRDDVEPWARLAIVQHEQRVERVAQKLAAARKVLGA